MNRRSGWTVAALLVAGLQALHGQVPTPRPPPELGPEEVGALPAALDLDTAIALARRYSSRVGLARERWLEQDERRTEVRGQRGPRADLVGAGRAQDDGLIEGFGAGLQPETRFWQAGAEVRQPLYHGGALRARARAQDLRGQAAEEEARAARYDVMLETTQAFFGALLARETVSVQEESLRLLEEQEVLARNRFEAGAGSRFDVLQAEVAARSARPPLLRARSQSRLAIEELRRVVGLPFAPGQGPDEIVLTGGWPFPRVTFGADDAFAAALRHRPELAAVQRLRQAGEKDLEAARYARRPQVDAVAGYYTRSRQFGDGLDDTLDGWEVGVQASFPLFASGQIRSRIRQAASRVRQADLQEQALRQAIEVEVARAYADWKVALEILDTAQALIDQAAEALRLAGNRFQAGAITQVDVLQSELGLTRARLEKVQASHDYNLAVARLNRAMGLFAPGERMALPGTKAPDGADPGERP